ncbi:FixH family protein [Alteriqipengyuania sp. 357]
MNKFTGKHMAAVMVGGFGIVIAVNFYMASLATSGFGGVVVKNSYVASQNYNQWLEEAREQEATGWTMSATREPDGAIAVATEGAPQSAELSAVARRPLGERGVRALPFVRDGENRFVSTVPLDEGRWTLRLALEDGARKRIIEAEIQ